MRRILIVILGLLVVCLPWLASAQTTVISGPRIVQGGINYAGTAVRTEGTPDTFALVYNPALTVLPVGMCVGFIAATGNTDAVSLVVNALAPVPLVKRVDGVSRPLSTGDIGAGQFLSACYDGTNFQVTSLTRTPPAVFSTPSAATVDPDCDLYDQYTFTALASNLTINIPGNGAANCTPANGQILVFSFANSTADTTRTLTWAGIESVGGYSEESSLALPTTTIANKVLTLQVRYNATTTHWALVAMTPLDTTSDSTPRRVAISLTNGVATVPGPDTADMVYHHNLIEGTGNDVHFNAPTGAATAGQKLLFELFATQAGVVDVSWDADAYCFNGGIARPTRVSGTAVTQIYDYWQFLRNPTAGSGGTPCWVLIAVASSTEALEPGTLIMGEAGGASAAYGAFTVPPGSLDLSGAINGSAGTPHLTYVQPSPPARQSLVNTRVRQEVAIVPTTNSLDPDCDLYEQYSITALAETLTINSPGTSAANCTPTDGQYLVFLFANSAPATTHALSWTTGVPGAYSNEHTIPLPTVTLADKVLAVQFRYNAATLRWGLIGTTPVGSALVNPMTLSGQLIYGGAAGAPTALGGTAPESGLLRMNGTTAPTIDDAATVKTFLALNNVNNTADGDKIVAKAGTLLSNPAACPAGEFVKDIADDGTLDCDPEVGTGTVTAGTASQGSYYATSAAAVSPTTAYTADADALLTVKDKCTAVSGNTTLGAHLCLQVTTTGGNVVVTLPAAASGLNTRKYLVYKVSNDSNTLTLRRAGSDTMNGTATDRTTIAQWAGWTIQEQSSANWYVQQIKTSLALSDFAPITTDRLLGRDTAGSGVPEEVSLNTTLEFTGAGAIQRAALTGAVTASAGSNATVLAAPHRTKACVVVIGDPGTASPTLANDNDSPDVCPNDFGAVWTITTVACKSNTGAPTITPVLTGGAPTSLVTGAITCGQTWTAGTVQSSPAAALNSFSAAGATCTSMPCTIDVNITAASTAKYIVVKIVGTLPGT